MEQNPETGIYAWERTFEKSWEDIEEDDSGALKSVSINIQRKRKLRLDNVISAAVHRGMLRFTILCLDLSKAVTATDIKPSRYAAMISLVEEFIKDYFDQNPLSNLGIVVCKDGLATKITDLSSNPKFHIKKLNENLKKGGFEGDMSLYNCLSMSKLMLKDVPTYGSKEIIVIHSSLNTCDPGNVIKLIGTLKSEKTRCSSVGLGGEVFVFRRMAEVTNGSFAVPLDRGHLQQILQSHVIPPPTRNIGQPIKTNFVEMGFPRQELSWEVLCSCHKQWKSSGYICPRCYSLSCDIPTTCGTCSLPLISAPHLARSYHHLDPVPAFKEKQDAFKPNEPQICWGCKRKLRTGSGICLECPECTHIYCIDCDEYIHNALHVCPGCNLLTRK